MRKSLKVAKQSVSQPILESPPSLGETAPQGAHLFSEEAITVVMAKVCALEEIFRLLTRDCDFDEFTLEALLALMRAIKCEAGSILEVDQENRALFFRAATGQSSDRLKDFIIPLGQGIAGYVAESKQILAAPNVAEDQKHLKSIEAASGFKVKNMIAVPILIRGKTFGVVELLNRVGEDHFTSVDQDLLVYLSEILAKAVEIRLMIAWAGHRTGTQEAA